MISLRKSDFTWSTTEFRCTFLFLMSISINGHYDTSMSSESVDCKLWSVTVFLFNKIFFKFTCKRR